LSHAGQVLGSLLSQRPSPNGWHAQCDSTGDLRSRRPGLRERAESSIGRCSPPRRHSVGIAVLRGPQPLGGRPPSLTQCQASGWPAMTGVGGTP